MLKILFLPFLQIPTGHHLVADALIRSLEQRVNGIYCKKVDFLSYLNKRLEKIISHTYIKWIGHAPQIYDRFYQFFVYPLESTIHLELYENLFSNKMEQMIKNESPDLIICTQAYPSYLIDCLKQQKKIHIPVINIYTDFFINKIWGSKSIDYHFVPNTVLKTELQTRNIPANRIIVTGIPIDECFVPEEKILMPKPPYHILISGGNWGLGDICTLVQDLVNCKELKFSLLCGNNIKLYQEISALNIENLTPHPYVVSRKEMNNLYNNADALITKPGGVTISEALAKKLPTFVHSFLPGQEEINLKYLTGQGLVFKLNSQKPIKEQVISFLKDESRFFNWLLRVEDYLDNLESQAWQKILDFAEDLLKVN